MAVRHDDGPRALVVGESLVDVTRRSDGTESARAGGSPLNVAVGLSRLEVATTLATQIGDDEHGELLRTHLDASDVELRSVPPNRTETASALARIDAAGAATYHFSLAWDPDELPEPDDFDLLHVGSIGAALAPGADAVGDLVREAHRKGTTICFDPNVRPAITPDLDDVRRRFEALAPLARICKLSDEDARVLYPGASPEHVARRLLDAADTALVAITLGSDGAILGSRGALVHAPATVGSLVDTIGAGDSFMSAVLAGLAHRNWLGCEALHDDDLTWLGRLAGSAAAITCSRAGADPPYLRELDQLAGID